MLQFLLIALIFDDCFFHFISFFPQKHRTTKRMIIVYRDTEY